MAGAPASAGAPAVALSIDDVVSPAFSLRAIRAELTAEPQRLSLAVGEVRVRDRVWRNVRLDCPRFNLTTVRLDCPSGTLTVNVPMAVSVSYVFPERALTLVARPAPDEIWRMVARFGEGGWNATLNLENAALLLLDSWLPEDSPRLSAGRASGLFAAVGDAQGLSRVETDLMLREVAFSDAAGQRAGDKVEGRANLSALRQGNAWQWRAALDWSAGEVYWQPFYSRGGFALQGEGSADGDTVRIVRGELQAREIGAMQISGRFDIKARTLRELEVAARSIALPGLYRKIVKPLMEGTVAANLEVAGEASLALRMAEGQLREMALELRNASVADRDGRFSVAGLHAEVPWHEEAAREARLAFRQASLLRVPVGATELRAKVHPGELRAELMTLPVLDGTLTLTGLTAARDESGWRWRFGGGLSAMSMEKLTAALGVTPMHGTLSAVIPEVSYGASTLKVGGALLFRVFDGTVVARNLEVVEPLGRAPRLRADLGMRNLDLDLLTRTFAFGSMQGKVDVEVSGLELSGWRPVRFDARVASSPGRYPRRVSQRAVENISALGGAGAVPAIQRSFLRFFDTFGYSRLGLSCRLEKRICHMDGIAQASGGYVIVEGGGIPAITIIGYNREVGWDELVGRLARVTQQNVKAVVN